MDAKAENTGAVSGDKSEQAEQSGTGDLNEKAAEEQYAELMSKGFIEAEAQATPPEPEPELDPAKAKTGEEPGTDKTDEDSEESEAIEGVSAKAQAKINERIHDLNIRRKNAEAKAEEAEQRASGLEKRMEDEAVKAAMKLGVSPEYIEPEEAKTISRYNNLLSWRTWCKEHKAGYEGKDGAMSEEDVAERRETIEEELLEIGPDARRIVSERAKQQHADMMLGRKLRLARTQASGAARKPKLKPPVLPSKPAGAGTGAPNKPPISAGKGAPAAFSEDEFNKDGADEDALEKQYQKLMAGAQTR